MNIVRTLGIFMALAALSFVLGFFVLARLVPGGSRPSVGAALPASGAGESADTGDTLAPGASGSASAPDSKRATGVARNTDELQPPKQAPLGPSLDPETDTSSGPAIVQKPRKIPDSTQKSTDSAPDDTRDNTAMRDDVESPKPAPAPPAREPQPTRRRRSTARTLEPPTPVVTDDEASARDEADAQDPSDVPVARTRRPRHARAAATDEPDVNTDDQADTERPAKRRRAETVLTDSMMYHVRLGSFHSRDAADREVERARLKGFSTQVVPVTHNGRTLYRVQAGAFRERTRAESIKQSLQDASLDASVSEQRN